MQPKFFFLFLLVPFLAQAEIRVGTGYTNITPQVNNYSAGCLEREGKMTSIYDPLGAYALVIENGKKTLAFCSVDHLGFLRAMVKEVEQQVHAHPSGNGCEIFLSSTHTHSGAGGYFEIPSLGELIAGPYNPELVQLCTHGASQAILKALQNLEPAKMGIGYETMEGLTTYAGVYPPNLTSPKDIALLKLTKLDNTPLAVFINASIYPDLLTPAATRMGFSADVIGYIRKEVQKLLGDQIIPVFFNGAKGELESVVLVPENRFKSCEATASIFAKEVERIWKNTPTKEDWALKTFKDTYLFEPLATPSGFVLPVAPFDTEINLITFDHDLAFVTIPGELSCSCDAPLKQKAAQLGLRLSILDIVNDAHGYIYSPESWRRKPAEVEFSWGGEMYGHLLEKKILQLLKH